MNLFLSSEFSNSGDALKKYIDTNRKQKVAFIANATDLLEDQGWTISNREKLIELNCEVFDLDLRITQNEKLKDELENYDAVYVEGGNNIYLLEISNKSGFTNYIKDFLNSERWYISTSAGSIHAGPSIESTLCLDEDYKSTELNNFNALGLVDFVVVPHIGGEFQKMYPDNYKKMFDNIDKYSFPHILIRDNQAVVVMGDNINIVSS